MIKLREIILTSNDVTQGIKGFTLVPLYEKLESKKDERCDYRITGVQLMLRLSDEKSLCHIDLRNLMNTEVYKVYDELEEINYK